MGWAAIVPLLPFIVLISQLLTFQDDVSRLIYTLQFLIAPFSCWWVIFLFQEYFEGGMDQLLPSYPLSKWEHGLIKSVLVIFIYFIITIIVLFATSMTVSGLMFGSLLVNHLSLSLLFSSIGFLLVTSTKNVVISLSVIAIYTVTEYMTRGSVIPWYHLFTFDITASRYGTIDFESVGNVLGSIIFFSVGQFILNKKFNFIKKQPR